MKAHTRPTLFLCTSMMGLYWAGYYTMLGIWGLKFSVWNVVIFLGALLLGAGAFREWALPREWALSLLFVGSSAMIAYWMIPSLHALPDYIGYCILIVFFGAILSGASELLQWVLPRRWQHLLPVVGSLMMASFFVPAALYNLSRFIPAFDSLPSLSSLLPTITVVFVVSSLVLALKAMWHAFHQSRLSHCTALDLLDR